MNVEKNKLKRSFAYTQIASHLSEKIASGELAPGSYLISERKLAAMYDVNHTTARKATQILVNNGLVKKIRGKGNLVTDCQEKRKGTKFIGFILCKREKSIPFYFELITCIEKELKKFGFHLIFSSYDDTSGNNEIPKILTNSAIDGVILTGEVPQKLLFFLRKNNVNHVLVTHSNNYDRKSNIVASDDNDIGYKASNYLLKLHKKIAFIRGSKDFRPHDMLRENGFVQGFEENGLHYDKKKFVECNSFDSAEISRVANMLLRNGRPDAIFVTNIIIANKVALVFREKGIKIPDEVEFAVFSGSDKNEVEPMTKILTNCEEISQAAVNRLLDMIHGRAVGISINLIPAVLLTE